MKFTVLIIERGNARITRPDGTLGHSDFDLEATGWLERTVVHVNANDEECAKREALLGYTNKFRESEWTTEIIA